MVTPENKWDHFTAVFKRNPKELLRHFRDRRRNFDSPWYTPETKEPSKQWTEPGERAPKKAKTMLFTGKMMATIVKLYYDESLRKFDAELQKKTAWFVEKVLFHQYNALAHISAIAMIKLVKLGYVLLPHTPYSPNLDLCDFFLFKNLKNHPLGRNLSQMRR